MRLTFLGTADAFNGAGRGNSCYLVDDALGCYALDFGPTALRALHTLGRRPDEIDAVYLTHLHGDHIGGLALLIIDQQFRGCRERPLTIAGPPGTRARVEMLRDSAYPGAKAHGLPFELRYLELPVPGESSVLGRTVQTLRAKHDTAAIASSLRITTADGDLAFSGDTGWHDALGEFVTGADVFVCECSGVEVGFWGHLSVQEITANRAKIEVGQLVLSHFSEAARQAATEAGGDYLVADDGDVLDVKQLRAQAT